MKTNLSRSLSILLTLLLAACGPLTPMPTITPSATASVPSSTPTLPPTETPTPAPQQPPACTFPLAQTTMEESKPEQYTFSEPEGLPNSSALINIIEWLPDSQKVLITRDISNTTNENIELFNPQTGETHIYAVRKANMWFPPLWIEKLKSVIYSDILIISSSYDNNGKVISSSIVEKHQVRLSRGNPNNTQIFEDVQYSPAIMPHEWIISSLAVNPNSSQIVYLKSNGEQPYQLYSRLISNETLEAEQQSKIQWINSGERSPFEVPYKMSWRTNSSQTFFYSPGSFTNQTLLLDNDSGQVCTLSLGGWVYVARWSPNGRYLAAITSKGSHYPLSENYDLVVLDMASGILYPIDSTKVGPPEMKDCCRHIISEITWAPDNRHLAIVGTATFSGTANNTYKPIATLYLVDFLSGKVDNPFPQYEFNPNLGSGLAWSPDGLKLLATCSTETKNGLCLVPVQRTPSP